jgi:hypothetical protein
MKSVVLALAAVAMLCASPSFAQTARGKASAPPTPPAQTSPVQVAPEAAAPDPGRSTREALVRKYFAAIQFDKLMDTLIASMTQQQLAANPDLTPEHRAIIASSIRGAINDVFPTVMDRYTQLYAEVLTEQELTAMVRFYESEIGRSVMQKSQMLAGQSGSLMQEFTPQIEAAMMRRLCAQMTCPEAGAASKGQ